MRLLKRGDIQIHWNSTYKMTPEEEKQADLLDILWVGPAANKIDRIHNKHQNNPTASIYKLSGLFYQERKFPLIITCQVILRLFPQ